MVAWILLIIGGLNWLLTAFGWGVQNWIPGSIMMIVYILVGLSAIYELFTHKANCKACMDNSSSMSSGAPMGGQM